MRCETTALDDGEEHTKRRKKYRGSNAENSERSEEPTDTSYNTNCQSIGERKEGGGKRKAAYAGDKQKKTKLNKATSRRRENASEEAVVERQWSSLNNEEIPAQAHPRAPGSETETWNTENINKQDKISTAGLRRTGVSD